jgi:hypothetical protein
MNGYDGELTIGKVFERKKGFGKRNVSSVQG